MTTTIIDAHGARDPATVLASAQGAILAHEGELRRLRACEARLAAMTRWLEQHQPDVFARGLWDAVNASHD